MREMGFNVLGWVIVTGVTLTAGVAWGIWWALLIGLVLAVALIVFSRKREQSERSTTIRLGGRTRSVQLEDVIQPPMRS